MTVESLHHVQLAMPPGGEDEATVFDEGLLGLRRVAKPPRLEARGGCWFENGATRVHVAAGGVDIVDDEALPLFDRFYAYDPFGNRLGFLAPARVAGRSQDQRP